MQSKETTRTFAEEKALAEAEFLAEELAEMHAQEHISAKGSVTPADTVPNVPVAEKSRTADGKTNLVYRLRPGVCFGTDGVSRTTDNSLFICGKSDNNDFIGYENRRGSYKAKFAENLNGGRLFRIRKGTSELEWSLADPPQTPSGAFSSRKAAVRSVSSELNELCGEVRYREIAEHTALRYRVEEDKVKEEIILSAKREAYEYSFCIKASGLTLRKREDGEYIIAENGSDEVFVFPVPFMTDAAGNESDSVVYELNPLEDGKYLLTVKADAEWLNAEERVFPVVIDPTIQVADSALSARCLQSGKGSSSVLRAGKYNNKFYRTYIFLSDSAALAGNIVNAQLTISFSSAYNAVSGRDDLFVAPLSSSSGKTASQFVAQGAACDIFTLSSDKLSASADVTKILRRWNNGSPNWGFSVYSDESFCALSAAISDISLSMTCQEQKAKAGTAFQKNDAKRAGSSAVDLFSGRLLFEHKDVKLNSNVLPVLISHQYNSDYYNEEANDAMKLGKGWRLNLQQQIFTELNPNGTVPANSSGYFDANGIKRSFVQRQYLIEEGETPFDDSDSSRTYKRYVADGGETEYTTKDGRVWLSSSKSLYSKNGLYCVFAAAGNRLSQIRIDDKSLTITYSGNRITKVTDGAGKVASFSYNASGYLTSITYPGEKTVSFAYSGDKLISITDADGEVTSFSYTNNRLSRVTDCSGYRLDYSYDSNGNVIKVEESAANASISASGVSSGSAAGDSFEISYLSPLLSRVKNRSGVALHYIFDSEGNLVTRFESAAASSLNHLDLVGKVAHKRTYLAREIPDSQFASYGYKSQYQTTDSVLFNNDNLTGNIENWARQNTSSGDGVLSSASADSGSSFFMSGDIATFKKIFASPNLGSLDKGVYIFGCWVKASVLSSVDRHYGNGSGRYAGIMLKYTYGTGGGEHVVYAPVDPYNEDWQLVAVPVFFEATNVAHVELSAVCARTLGSVYFDRPYFAKASGGVTYMYDNNYSETIYRDYRLVVLYDYYMNPVKTVSVVNGKQYSTRASFDSIRNFPISSSDWRGRTTEKSFDDYGNLLSETLSSSNGSLKLRTSSAYSGHNYLTGATDEIGNTSTFQYDGETGELVKGTFPEGQAISYSYDPFGALKKVTALSNTNNLVYDKGYLVQLSHAGSVYKFVYDGFGRIKSVTLDGTTILTNTYTDFGSNIDGVAGAVSRIFSTDGNGDTQTAYFDKYGKTLGIKQGSGTISSETYDANDNLTQHIDNVNGIEYNYAYTKDGDLAEHTQKKNGSQLLRHVLSYDGMDRVSGESYTIGARTFNYGYSYVDYPEEDLTAMTTPLGQISYTKDGLGRLTDKVRVAGYGKKLTSKYYYNNSNVSGYTTRQVSKLYLYSEGATTRILEYAYDANGNITAITQRGFEYMSFEYDGLNRLTRENVSGQRSVRYSYDTAGNITEKQIYPYTSPTVGLGSGNIQKVYSYSYDTSHKDRLISYDGKSISYNAAGYPTNYLGNAVTWSQGRMTKFGSTTFAYNDAGVRSRKGTTEYYAEGTRILAEKRNGTMIYYFYDESGVAGFEYGGKKYYYQKNLQGDVLGIYDDCGNLLGSYLYDARGKILAQSTNNILSVNPFRYRGYYYDTETSLYYLNTRYYDPETGRFISPDSTDYLDPVAINGLNLYAYCGNNPVMYVDPNGSFPVLALILGVTAIAGMGLTIGGVASNNNILTAIGLTMVAVPALISGGMAIAAGIDGATFLGMMGGGTVVAGLGSALFASAEYQTIFTGNNWMLNAGMSNEWYYGLMLTTTTLATIGTISCGVLGSIGNMSSANTMMNSLKNHPGRWKIVKQQISKALGRKYKGGISKYTNYVNRWTGARLGTHEIIRNEIYIHGPHIHPWI